MATFNMEDGVVRRIRSVFRKKAEEAPAAEKTGDQTGADKAAADKPTAEKAADTDWLGIRSMLMRVLDGFPEAKTAVVKGLVELRGLDPSWAT